MFCGISVSTRWRLKSFIIYLFFFFIYFFFQAEDGIRDLVRSRGLGDVYKRQGQEYIKAFLKAGTGAMPQFHLSEAETKSLLSFLKDIDASGKSDPKTFTPVSYTHLTLPTSDLV